MSEWKPGDVALVDSWRGKGQIAFCVERIQGEPRWCVLDGSDTRGLSDNEIQQARPVVVIDPEDAEQVERLFGLVEKWSGRVPYADMREDGDLTDRDALATALREFARPTPPRPEEPMGLGAVVEDAEGYLWTCAVNENRRRWWNPLQGGWCDYADLAAVEVLSRGVEV